MHSEATDGEAGARPSVPHRPFYDWLGLEVAESREGRGMVRLPYRQELGNSRGNIHGGAIASLLDAALSAALRSSLPATGNVVMVSMTVAFLEPGQGSLVGHGHVIRCGRAVAVVEGNVEDERGVPVAHGLATFRVYSK